jgi:hypothetical protein
MHEFAKDLKLNEGPCATAIYQMNQFTASNSELMWLTKAEEGEF